MPSERHTEADRDEQASPGTERSRLRRLGPAVRHNLRGFRAALDCRGLNRERVCRIAAERVSELPATTRTELQATARAAGVPYRDLLAFTLFDESVSPDGCTVAAATGAATAGGGTVFFKQSDKDGAASFEGQGYHRHRQVNVVRTERPTGRNHVVGVTAAGSTALKMGMNDRGVAVGSNFAATAAFDADEADLDARMAVSRGEYLRQGLLHGDTAVEVAQHVAARLLESPMASPGIIEVADADRVVVLEGAQTSLAGEWTDDGVVVRANAFGLLDDRSPLVSELASSRRRADRAETLLAAADGAVAVGTMRDLSVDHANGPGDDSICRHETDDYTDAASLSAAVFDIDGERPAASDCYLALGTPCHAWRSDEGDGWLRLSPTATADDVPERFLTGEAWLDYYSTAANDGPVD
ncbi:C45 family autoproteolytic acyltransferase/hydolase [Halomarina oriensis]|uniref:Uncharacterized protein n=1 Tax=Halomarina oriensis TaxID=671145 RepID=A0A6B0GJL3_9EURY|nr:C45 family autoproteolytic acyltransferase/hydolase [Halomarina oriensis]MWG34994.1 hypothetical protein [Halomarina oriensis]